MEEVWYAVPEELSANLIALSVTVKLYAKFCVPKFIKSWIFKLLAL